MSSRTVHRHFFTGPGKHSYHATPGGRAERSRSRLAARCGAAGLDVDEGTGVTAKVDRHAASFPRFSTVESRKSQAPGQAKQSHADRHSGDGHYPQSSALTKLRHSPYRQTP
jgi:hypothetical protein